MHITINGESHTIAAGLSLRMLIETLQLDLEKIAVEHNLEIIPAGMYHERVVNEGDQIEIVHFIGGG